MVLHPVTLDMDEQAISPQTNTFSDLSHFSSNHPARKMAVLDPLSS
jgi:hypothetical protein